MATMTTTMKSTATSCSRPRSAVLLTAGLPLLLHCCCVLLLLAFITAELPLLLLKYRT